MIKHNTCTTKNRCVSVKKKTCSVLLSMLICIGSSFVMGDITASADTYNFPRVVINTTTGKGNSLVKKDDYVEAQIQVIDKNGKTIEDTGEIKVRGNTTARAAKKPYNFKFKSKQNVFGMGKNKKWALLANCFDPTLLRNAVAFELAEELGLEYTPEHQFVELYLDDEFKGCYELVEPIQAKSGRVDIDIEGNKDFLVQYESSRVDKEAVYITPGNYRFEVKDPEKPDEVQQEYINNTMTEIIDAIKSHDYEMIEKYIDTDSFAAYYLLNEFYKTVDFNFSSVYFYYKDGILYAGPAWDYDLSSGNTYETNIKKKSTDGQFANVLLFSHLSRCPEFMEKVRNVYREHYDYIKNIYAEDGQIDQLVKTNEDLFTRNYTEAGWDVSKSYDNLMRTPDLTYSDNIEYFKNWLSDRNTWMSEYYCIFDDDNYKEKYAKNLSNAPIVYYVPGEGTVNLTWTSVSGAQKYGVAGFVNGRWQELSEGFGTSCVLENLKAGKEYKVAVITMVNGKWKPDYSNAITVTPNATVQPSDKSPKITSKLNDNDLALRWNAMDGAEKYAVCGFFNGRWQKLDETTDNTYDMTDLNYGTKYKIAVISQIDGRWINDFTNAIEVTPLSNYPAVTSAVSGSRFRLEWSSVENAEKYGLAVYENGRWKILSQVSGDITVMTSPEMDIGTYKMVVCAKVNDEWDISNIESRAFTVEIQ